MKFNDPGEFFIFIVDKSGISIIENSQQCLSVAMDLLDGEKSYFKLLKLAFNNGVYKELIKPYNSDSESKTNFINKAIKILSIDLFIQEEKAIETVGWLAKIIYPDEWDSFISKSNKNSEEVVQNRDYIPDNNSNNEHFTHKDDKKNNTFDDNSSSNKLVKRAMLSLEVGDFVKADEFTEKALDLDPENPNAYLVKLLVECKIQKPEDLIDLPNSFDGSNNFKMVIRFADKYLKDRMNGFVEERRKYSIYKEAVSHISDTSIDSNKKAKELFESIIDFKDSKDKIEKCEYNFKLIPYKEACNLMNSNSVDANRKAIKIFESIEDFKDSKDKILECEINLKKKIPYNEACNLMSNISIDSNKTAISFFEPIIDYKDSKEKIEECKNNINQIIYNNACALMKQLEIESNNKAIKLFESIIDFSDSSSKIEQCKKNNEEIYAKTEQKRIKFKRKKTRILKLLIGGVAIIIVIIIASQINEHNKKLERERQEKARIEREAREAKEKAEREAGEAKERAELEAREAKERAELEAIAILANMVKCPAGSFMMGSPSGELGRYDNEKQHQVTISKPFYIGKYEVTQKEYEAVMRKNPSKYRGENKPVECINWNDAKEFCYKLNKYAKNIPHGYKYDLPTEAQWEYACRAGTTTSLNSGKNITSEKDPCDNLDEVGWYYDNSRSETHAVGQKKPNVWGIYDMHGNVWEWCRDLYNDYSTSAVTDPMCNTGSNRVLRGGSWYGFANSCRSANRDDFNPDDRNDLLGFRLALVPVD